MRRNRVMRNANALFSGKHSKVGRLALCILGTAAAFCAAYTLSLPAITVDSETRKPFEQDQVALNDTCEVEAGGFVMTFHIEKNGGSKAECEEESNTVHKPAGSLRALSASSEKLAAGAARLSSAQSESNSSQKSQVKLHVEKVTQGEHYEALMTEIMKDPDGLIAPPQVMELTASLDGRKLDLSGCRITVQVDPNQTLVEAAIEGGVATASLEGDDGWDGKPGMVVTVLPLGGEPVVQHFTSEEMESGEALPSVAVTYTVPEGAPALYAVSARTAAVTEISGNVEWDTQKVITQDTTINLKGHTITCAASIKGATDTEIGETYDASSFLILVKSGATLTIKDSVGGGGITANGQIESLITVEDGGTLNIQGGTMANNGGSRVILAFGGDSTVNVAGGAITGANKGVWGGAGIYAEGTVNISGGEISGNTAGSGGGVYAASGTVNISGGSIANNTSTVYGGGVYTDTGTVNISGDAVIKGNTAVAGGGVCASNGSIVMQGGTISNNTASSDWEGGGGVYAKTMELSGGEISGNKAPYSGGGIYARRNDAEGSVTITGGKISGNQVTGSNPNARGGGVATDLMIMRGGEISGNTSPAKGGGVYATRMMMTNGTVSKNTVQGVNAVGGGGIFIDQGEAIFNDGGMVEHGIYNMSVTGGTISGNTSYHVGGGIYIGVGAKVHIRGTSGLVYITGNSALDQNYTYGGTSGHGFAGGGIFVEHPDIDRPNSGEVDKDRGGQLYLYDAVVTGNTAQHGGGVAGCGASSIMISSASGVAVYDNTATGRQDDRFSLSPDLYCDGNGTVGRAIQGSSWVKWSGKQKDNVSTKEYNLNPISPPAGNGDISFPYGFYLKADQVNRDVAQRNATVFIQNNRSNSGGGGIGGNGYMELGFQPPPEHTLVLKKIVKDSDTEKEFTFTVALTGSDGNKFSGTANIKKKNGGGTETDLSQAADANGSFTLALKNNESVTFTGLPSGTKYTIAEEHVNGFKTVVSATNAEIKEDGSVSGELSSNVGSLVEFTNTYSYEMPATGGGAAVVYIAGALLATAVAGILIYKKCAGKREDRQ